MANDKRSKCEDPGNMPYQPPDLRKQWEGIGGASGYKCRIDRNIIRRGGRFAVRLYNGQKQITLGTYDTAAEARAARDAEEARLGLRRKK